jgi:lipoyl(octanoyl) transferase
MIRELGVREYEPVWRRMQAFTEDRGRETPDECWLVQHPAVFTLGLNGKAEHLLDPHEIPVIAVDRGGQVTYHGPGQLVMYLLLDLNRLGIGVRELVRKIEAAIIDLLASHGVPAQGREDAPGVYVEDRKIAALGLRIKRGRSYHGLSLNVDMDLEPFQYINPCGYPGMAVTQLKDLGIDVDMTLLQQQLVQHLRRHLGYTKAIDINEPIPA